MSNTTYSHHGLNQQQRQDQQEQHHASGQGSVSSEQQYGAGGPQPEGYAGARGSGKQASLPQEQREQGFAQVHETGGQREHFNAQDGGFEQHLGEHNQPTGPGLTDTGVHGRRPDPSIPAEPAPPIAGGGLGDYQSRGQHDQQEHSTSHEHSAEGKQKHGHVGLAGFEAKLPHSDTPHNSLDGVGGGYGAGVAGKHDGFNFKNRDTSTHDPTLEHSSHQYQHHGHSDHSTPPSGAGAGVGAAGAGVGAGVTHTGTGTGTGSSTHQEPHKKASIVDKVVGGAEVLVGKVTKDTAMVEEGQARKTGVQTHNAAALNKEGAPHAHGEGHTVHKDEAPRGAAGFGSSGTSGAH